MSSTRYTADITKFEPETFAIIDAFTGRVVEENLTDPEATQDRVERLNKNYTEAQAIVETLAQFANRGGSADEFAAALSREHRTLQQSVTGLFIAWIESLAKLEEGRYDLRNAGSVKLAKALVASAPWKEKYLPYV